MMRKLIGVLIGLVLFLLASAGFCQLPNFELTPGVYNLTWNTDIEINNAEKKYNNVDTLSRIKVMPKHGSSSPKIMSFPIDGAGDNGLLFVVLDESKGTGKGWDTAYIDLNRNGDLTDDKPIMFSLPMSKNYGQAHTGWVAAQTHQGVSGSESTQHPMQVRLDIRSYGKDDMHVQLNRKGTWTGKIDSNRGKVVCVTIDANCNAVFGDFTLINDEFQPAIQGDELYIDIDGYGSVATLGWGLHRIPLYNVTKVAEKFYQIKVNELGNRIAIEPYNGKYGQLKVYGENIKGFKANVESVSAIGAPGIYAASIKDRKPISLPVGKYLIGDCQMVMEAKDKNPLPIHCTYVSVCDLHANKLTRVLISGKLSLDISPEIKKLIFTQGEIENIDWVIKIGNKTVVDSIGYKDISNPPAVKFYDKNGKLIHATSAGYT